MPPRERPPTARTIRIEDIDRGVKQWFENVLDAHVLTPQKELRKVTVKFSSGERWVASADKQGTRDRDGRLILPIIHITRTGIDLTNQRTALGSNVPRVQIAKLVSEKTADLSNLDSSRPISNRRLRDSAVYDVWTIPYPSDSSMTYKVQIQAQYQTHINEIIEKMLHRLEFFTVPTFVIPLTTEHRDVGIPTGEGSTELEPPIDSDYSLRKPLDDYYVVGYIDGDISDSGNLEEFTDQERILQLQFGFWVPTALMLDPRGERPAVQRTRTAFGITLGDEEVHFVDDPADADKIFGRGK